MPKTIFFIVGEPSGDALGASLMRAMKAKEPDVRFVGIGGPLMEGGGLKSLMPMEDLCFMGLVEVLKHIPHILRSIRKVADEVVKAEPDALVTIDLPDFNFEVVKRLRKQNFQTRYVHYIAPSVWAWRAGRAKKVAEIYDLLLCAFPFEPPFFTRYGLATKFIGHSMVERVQGIDPKTRKKELGFKADEKVLGLFFGSRHNEFALMSETIAAAAKKIESDLPGVRFLVPTLPQNESVIKQIISTYDLNVIINTDVDKKWETFGVCDAAIAVSGTVALELAYLKVPHILAYKAHPVTAFIVRNLIKIKNIHLANIIMDKNIVPEFLQENCAAEKLYQGVLPLLNDAAFVQAQKDKLVALGHVLGEGDKVSPSEKAAVHIWDMF